MEDFKQSEMAEVLEEKKKRGGKDAPLSLQVRGTRTLTKAVRSSKDPYFAVKQAAAAN